MIQFIHFKTPTRYSVLCLFSIALLLGSCGKKSSSDDSPSGDDSSQAAQIQSATAIIGNTLEGTSQSFIETYAQCSTQSFSACSSGVRTRTLNGCERSNSNNTIALIYGTVTLTFDSNSTCTSGYTASSGSVTRTVSNHYAESESSGYKVLEYTQTGTVGDKTISADDLKDFSGTTRSGGTTLTFTNANTRTITINGVHRRGVRASGLYGFWHTTYTTTPITVTRSSTDYTITSGSVVVAHNRLSTAVTHTFTNVVYPTDGSCCYPTSGTVSYSDNGQTINTVFSGTCGEVTIGGSAVTLPPCGAN